MSIKGKLPSSALSPDVTEHKQAEEALQEKGEAYLDLLENANDLVQSVAPDGRFLYVNRRWRETLGYTEEEISRLSLFDIIHPDSQAHCVEVFQQVISGGSVDRVEAAFVTKDGKKVMVEGSANCRFVDGKPIATRGIFRDITERKQSEELYRSLANNSPTGIFIAQEGKFVLVNPQFQKVTGYSQDELLGKEPLVLVYPEDREQVRENAVAMLKGNRSSPYEFRTIDKAGETMWHLGTVSSINYKGKPATLGNFIDITERKRMEDALRESEEKFYKAFHSSPSPTAIITLADGRFIDINDSFTSVMGYRREEVIGHTAVEVGTWVKEGDNYRVAQMLREHGAIRDMETEVRTKSGKPIVGLFSAEIINLNGEECVITAVNDITERKQAEELYRTLASSSPTGIHIIQDGKFVFVNTQVQKDMDFTADELLGTDPSQYVHPDDRERVGKEVVDMLTGNRSSPYEFRLIGRGGEIIWVLGTVTSIHYEGKRARLESLVNITERKRAEEELRNSEERFKVLFEFAPDAYYLNDLKGNFIDGNIAAEELTGYKRDELIGKTFLELKLLPSRQIPKAAKLLAKNALGKRTGPDEFILKRKDGSQVAAEISTFPVKIEGQTLVLGIARDITERRRMEDALRESEEKFYKAFHSSPGPMSITALADGRYIDVNDNFTPLMGYRREEAIGHTVVELGIWAEAGGNYRVAQMLRERGAVRDLEFKFRTKSGKVLTVLFSAETINLGGEQCVIAAVNDITQRKQLEHNLRERVKELECLYGIAVITEKPGITLDELCQQVVNLLPAGWQYPEITGTRIIIKDRKFETENYREIEWKQSSDIRVRGAKAGVLEVCYLEERPEIDEGPFSREERMLISAVAERVGENIERMQAEEELVEKTRQLEAASGAKSEFLASMSHELRTPLNVIMGFSELLLDGVPGEINDEQRECLGDVLGSGQHLLALINDVLDLSKVEAGKIELRLENLSLADIIDGVVQGVKPILDDNGHQLKVRVEGGLPQVHADKKRLRQVLLNLLSNAVKFSPAGGELGIEAGRQGEWCQVSVVDSGIGIRQEDQERIFEVFTQVDTLPERDKGGTGLGLALTRQFVEACGGKMWVESEYGKGSKFTFTLPLARESEPPLEEDKEELVGGLLKQRDYVI